MAKTDTPQTAPALVGDDYLTPGRADDVLTEDAVAAEFGEDVPGLDEEEGTPEGPRQEAQDQDAGDEAPEPEEEAPEEDTPLLSEEDTATLQDKYGEDSPGRDPEVRREIARAISAIREKDADRLKTLERDQAIRQQYDQALMANPELRDAFVLAAGGQRAPQGQAATTPQPQGPQEGDMPTLEDFRTWDMDKLYKAIYQDIPQRQTQQVRQLQEQLNAPRLADQLVWQSFRETMLGKLEQQGYADARQFADVIDNAVAAEYSKPGADRLEPEALFENALWSIPEARAVYRKAQVSAASSAETTRQQKAAREAPARKQTRPVKSGRGDQRQFYEHVRNLSRAGVNMDRYLVENDPFWTEGA